MTSTTVYFIIISKEKIYLCNIKIAKIKIIKIVGLSDGKLIRYLRKKQLIHFKNSPHVRLCFTFFACKFQIKLSHKNKYAI